MVDRVIAQKGPYAFDVEAGKKYLWCRCGLSQKQPLCDAAHRGTGIAPLVFTAEATETVYLCGCKHTHTEPMCDGTHEEV